MIERKTSDENHFFLLSVASCNLIYNLDQTRTQGISRAIKSEANLHSNQILNHENYLFNHAFPRVQCSYSTTNSRTNYLFLPRLKLLTSYSPL